MRSNVSACLRFGLLGLALLIAPAGCDSMVEPDPPMLDAPDGKNPFGFPTFVFPSLSCRDAKAGEPPGKSANNQVCTWQTVSGATEEGRRYEDYADCSVPVSQRGYFPVPPPAPPPSDTRMQDDQTYAAEANWVKSQVEASACVCCHKSSLTKAGASVWDIEAKGNWLNTFTPFGLAFAGGFVDSSLLGVYPKDQNNGFSRDGVGIPTTDPPRLRKFFENELKFRGKTPADFAAEPPTPAYFNALDKYKPTECDPDIGVRADGTIVWTGVRARYVQVLAAGSKNPGVPPNRDLPDGTLWRLDVPPSSRGVVPGAIKYGQLPAGTSQGFPKTGSPAPLVPGQTYYLYVQQDIMGPIARCLFKYPI